MACCRESLSGLPLEQMLAVSLTPYLGHNSASPRWLQSLTDALLVFSDSRPPISGSRSSTGSVIVCLVSSDVLITVPFRVLILIRRLKLCQIHRVPEQPANASKPSAKLASLLQGKCSDYQQLLHPVASVAFLTSMLPVCSHAMLTVAVQQNASTG